VELVGGSFVMLAFMAIMFLGVVYGYFTIRGSGISQHPYGGSGAPGAKAPSNAFGRDESQLMSNWSHGTR
jgi:hypothetical protein